MHYTAEVNQSWFKASKQMAIPDSWEANDFIPKLIEYTVDHGEGIYMFMGSVAMMCLSNTELMK